MAKRRGNGEGSIWKEGQSWRAAFSLDGRRVTRSFDTHRKCQNWLHDMKSQANQGMTYDATQLTLGEYLADWLTIHQHNIETKTAERYKQISRDYIIPNIGNSKLADLRTQHFRKLYATLRDQGVSIRNIRMAHSVLHKCLNDAEDEGSLGFNPTHKAKPPKMKKREMKVLSELEAMRLMAAAQKSRYGALIHLALATGMRQGELLGLKWSDLDWNRNILRIQRQVQRVTKKGMIFGPPKTDAGRRTIPLDQKTVRVLREHVAQQRLDRASTGEKWQDFDLIFPSTIGTPQSPSNLLREFKMLLGEAGVRVIRFHDLRHTAASHMLDQGVPISDVSKILGHSEPSTTLDIYTHLIPVAQDGAVSFSDESSPQLPVTVGEPAATMISSDSQIGFRSKLIARQLHVNPEACR